MVSGNPWAMPHLHDKGTKIQKQESPYTIVRSPSPPIRYERKWDATNHRNQRFGIRRHRSQPSRPKSARRKEISPPKRIPHPLNLDSAMSNSIITRNQKPSDAKNEKQREIDDDNMSLISMTNLIADDVCRLQNCRFDNIGPDIRHKSNAHDNSDNFSIIDMNVKTRPKGNTNRKGQPSKISKPNKEHSSSEVWDNKPTECETSDTGSMSSPSRSPGENRKTAQIEVEVNDDSDNISEITPTVCVVLERAKNKDGKATNNQHRNDNNQKDMTAEETFRDFLTSVAACLPNSGDIQYMKRSFSDAQTTFDIKKDSLLRSHVEGQNVCINTSYCDRNQGDVQQNPKNIFDYTNNNTSILQHGRNMLAPDSVASAPTTPYFRNNSDRYNHLVNGRERFDYDTQTDIDGKHRKFTPSWFKSKRETNRRRNNTHVMPPKEIAVPINQEHVPVEKVQGGVCVEVVWKQSKSFKEHKKTLDTKGSGGAAPVPAPKPTKTPILRKLLKRGKSKERKLLRKEGEEKEKANQAAVERPVSITAKDPTRWQPEQKNLNANPCDDASISKASKCVSSTVSSPGDFAIDVCNSDIAMAVVGVPPASAIARAASNRSAKRDVSRSGTVAPKTKTKKAGPLDSLKVTRKSVSPSRKSNAPVWRGGKDSDFHQRFPKVNDSTLRASRPAPVLPHEKKPLRKSRSRCYHRNSEHIDLADDESAPTMPWTRSRSYEDDFGQDDFKVVSIIGHHVSSSELERHATSSYGGVSNTLFSDRYQQVFTQSPERRHDSKACRGMSGGKYSSRSSPASSSSSESSSSSSSRERSSPRARSKSRGRSPRSKSKETISQRDAEVLQYLSDNDKNAEFDAAVGAMHYADNEYSSGSDDALDSPWRKDYKAHMASIGSNTNSSRIQAQKPTIEIGPLTPPKIQRSSDMSIPKISPPKRDAIPHHRHMLV